jgi:1-acyl-sn-glycerol-3-phosphate acyltransferase
MLYRMFFPLVKALVRTVFFVLGAPVRIRGAQHVPTTGGVLICPNHVSDADPAAIGVSLPRDGHFMAKATLFSHPVAGALLRFCRSFPVRRDSADRGALRHAEELLRAGEVVVIFPEGGGNEAGVLQPLHPGALLVALRTKATVVPVALVGTNRVWRYGAPLPRRTQTPVCVTFGEPLDLSDLAGKKGAVEEATRRLTVRLAAMLDQPIPQGRPVSREETPGTQSQEPSAS